MNTLSDIGVFAWQAIWLPIFVWTVGMGVLLLALKALPSKWIQLHLDLRLAGLMALVVGVVASWIFPLTPDATITFLAVNNPLSPPAPVAPVASSLVDPVSTYSVFTTVGMLTMAAILATAFGVVRLVLGGLNLRRVLSRSGAADHVGRVHSSVDVVVSEDTLVAFSAGIFRRKIVLPLSMAHEDLPAVLAHELSHHTSGDIARTWLSHSVRALFFFHPLVHHIHTECQLLTEIACDRRTLDGAALEPRAYADLLVRSTPQSNRNAPVLALAHSPSQLRRRITAMKNTIELPFSGSQLALFSAVFVLLFGGLVGCTDFQVGPTENEVADEGYELVMELPEGPSGTVEDVYTVVQQMPTLIGGLTGLQSTIQYPEIAKRAGVEGRVFLQFVVQPDGSVTDGIITRGIGAGCDEEALRMIQNARFIPGVQRGNRVPVKMSLPVTFKLNERGEPITDGAALKASNPPPPPVPTVAEKDVVILESFEDVDFEYDFVWHTVGPQNGSSDENLRGLAAQNGVDYVVKASPKNVEYLEQAGLKTQNVDPSKLNVGIRRK